MTSKARLGSNVGIALGLALFAATNAQAQLVVSQIYGDGGTATGPNGDFVEILNRSCVTVNLDDYSVQVATGVGTAWAVVPLPAFSLASGQYYLIRLNTAAGLATTADQTATTANASLTLTGGKVAIVLGDTALTGDCPVLTSSIIDFVKYLNATSAACTEGNFFNVTGAAAGTSVLRRSSGCNDTNVNSSNFQVGANPITLRNTSTALHVCPGVNPNWGACTLASGACLIETAAACDTSGGNYNGDCAPCPPIGSCCTSDGNCTTINQANCASLQGNWGGPGSNCSTTINYDGPNGGGPVICPGIFQDISATGATIPLVSGTDDGASAAIPMPFPFSFYGNPEAQYFIGANGLVSFQAAGVGTFGDPGTVPNAAVPNEGIYGLWDDLYSVTAPNPPQSIVQEVDGTAPNRVLIIQYTAVRQFANATGDNTFQIKLYESCNCIELHYVAVETESAAGDTTTVGVENASGSVGTQVFGPGASTRVNINSAMANNGGQCSVFLCPRGGTCPGNSGACCNGSTCAVMSQAACLELCTGVFQGNGTNCQTTACVAGACCTQGGDCVEVLSSLCAAQGGQYNGDNSHCAQTQCPSASACCIGTTCAHITQAACDAHSGTWLGPADVACTAGLCAQGRCCDLDGNCTVEFGFQCVAPNVFGGSGTTCTGTPCQGRCCETVAGDCAMTGPNGCTAPNVFGGLGTTCTGTPCQGACCAPNGDCALTGPDGCSAPNSFGGIGTTCSTAACQGACCIAEDGTCVLSGPATCIAPNVFAGLGSTCASVQCSGRCCQSDGSCTVTGVGACTGTFSIGQTCDAIEVITFNSSIPITDPVGGVIQFHSEVRTVSGVQSPITDLDVDVKINHTYFGDLVLNVEHLGVNVQLLSGIVGTTGCFAGDDPDIVLDDEGTGGPIMNVPCTNGGLGAPQSPPSYVPVAALSAFDGLDPNGDWTIIVGDDTGIDTGTLVRWSLHIGHPGQVCPVVGCTCFGDMNGDGVVDGKDVKQFAACVISAGTGAGCACANTNHDAGVNVGDVPGFITALLTHTCAP